MGLLDDSAGFDHLALVLDHDRRDRAGIAEFQSERDQALTRIERAFGRGDQPDASGRTVLDRRLSERFADPRRSSELGKARMTPKTTSPLARRQRAGCFINRGDRTRFELFVEAIRPWEPETRVLMGTHRCAVKAQAGANGNVRAHSSGHTVSQHDRELPSRLIALGDREWRIKWEPPV